MQTISFPSEAFPALSQVALRAPDDWVPIPAAGTVVSIAEPPPEEGVRSNVVATITRHVAPRSLDQDGAALAEAIGRLPGVIDRGARIDDLDGRPTLAQEAAFRHDSGVTLVQAHLMYHVGRGPSVDVVHVVGTVEGRRAQEAAEVVRSIVASARS